MMLVRHMMSVLLLSAATQALAQPDPVPAAAPARLSLVALNQLEAGLWQLEVHGRAPKQTCVSDPISLVQIEHEQPGCSRFVVANEPKSSIIHYSCQRAGWGRTTVRVETPRAAAIQTQGIARNAPFDYAVVARKIGACGAQASAKRR